MIPFYYFIQWEERRRKEGSPIRASRLFLFVGLTWCLFWHGALILLLILYMLEPDPLSILWLPAIFIFVVFSLPGILSLVYYFKWRIIVEDEYFLKCFGKKRDKIFYNNIIEYEIDEFSKTPYLRWRGIVSGITVVIDDGAKRRGTDTRRKSISGIGVGSLYEKINQYHNKVYTDVIDESGFCNMGMGERGIINDRFLMIESITLSHVDYYLMVPKEDEFTLYRLNERKRYHNLIAEHTNEKLVFDDVRIKHTDITDINLFFKKRFGMEKIHLTISTKEKSRTYVVSSEISSKQINEFLTKHCDINVNNQVEVDEEVLKRIKMSRMLNRFLGILSLSGFVFVVLGIRYPVLHALLLLWPIIITGFYIFRQDNIQFLGWRQGKSSIVFSYLCNPILTTIFIWRIILGVWQLTCLFQHPFVWLFGGLGAIILLSCMFRFVKEHHNKVRIKIGMIFISGIYGAQTSAVLLFLIH